MANGLHLAAPPGDGVGNGDTTGMELVGPISVVEHLHLKKEGRLLRRHRYGTSPSVGTEPTTARTVAPRTQLPEATVPQSVPPSPASPRRKIMTELRDVADDVSKLWDHVGRLVNGA